MAPAVAGKWPRPRNRRPRHRPRISGNPRWALWDERPFIPPTGSGTAGLGGTDTDMRARSPGSAPCGMETPFPRRDPAADAPNPETRVTDRNPVAALRRPDDTVPVAMDAMRGAIISHGHVLPEMSLCPERAAHFRKDMAITRFVSAEAISDWKSEASNQRVEREHIQQALYVGNERNCFTIRTFSFSVTDRVGKGLILSFWSLGNGSNSK